jgi:hypothetical protein
MKIRSILEEFEPTSNNEIDSDLINHRVRTPTIRQKKLHNLEFYNKISNPTLTNLKAGYAIAAELYNNRVYRPDPPDITGLNKSVNAYGTTKWITYTNNDKAYVLVWKNQKEHWFDTHLTPVV